MNYDQFRSLLCISKGIDKDEYFHMLVSPGADVIVLDEGHRIKNSTSAISNLINQIHTRSRICLTGYPLQNHLLEYYYMINFIAPGLLGSSDSFRAYFSNHIERCYTDSSDSAKLQASMKLYVLQLLTENVSHRRDGSILKKELPPKTEYVVRFKMSDVQLDGYKKLIENGTQAESPLIGLLVLRAICNHPKIFQSVNTYTYKVFHD
jgi:SNF2 family DNA or RNA helicase